MSSNTLRGIGQEGDGEDGDGRKADAANPTAATGQAGSAPADPKGATGTDRMPELRKIRSLDSTVPGTRSLDSSVPEAQPSLDGKVPSLAATMLGMTAPNIPGRDGGAGSGGDNARDKGTVQGRDVHLPVELQRRAGSMPIPGTQPAPRAEAAPQSVDYSEPTIADPVRVEHGTPEMNSHGPWYEQEPVGADAYDDPKPSMIGRVAIGAAVAASLAVVLFAIVRVRVQNQAAAEAEAAMPVRVPPPPSSLNVAPSPSPELGTTPTPAPSIPDEPPMPSEPAGGLDPSFGAGPAPAAAMPGPSRPSAYRPGASAGSYQPPRPLAAGAKSAPVPPLPNSLIRPKGLGDAPEGTPAAPAVTPPPVAATPETSPPAATPPVTPPPAEAPAAEAKPASPPPAETPAAEAKPAAPAKSKKKTDDPDSTLPLNLD